VGDNFIALFQFYVSPLSAISRILDRGRLWTAVMVAALVSIFAHSCHARVETPEDAEQAIQEFAPPGAGVPAAESGITRALRGAAGDWTGFSPFAGSFAPLGAIALALIPVIVAVRAFSGYGSFGVLMRSDYLSLLMCLLWSWAAAYLLAGILAFFAPALAGYFLLAANLYFTVLAILCLRTALGIGIGPAIGLGLVGWIAAVLGIAVFGIAGPLRYYVLSPFLLYYAYAAFGSDFRSLGEGLRSRQHLQQQLEIATNNPRDADAHYQLGLIYQKRRQYSEAISRFERAVAIDPAEADAHLQLGRIALEQQRWEDAIRHCQNAAAQDDKVSSSEVWRDLGSAYLGAGRVPEAAAALEKYVSRRPYDPEGTFRLGKALASLNRDAEARQRFEECIEAVNTSPSHRRAQVRHWGREAKSALRALPG